MCVCEGGVCSGKTCNYFVCYRVGVVLTLVSSYTAGVGV